jgi:hypothetical protein
MSSLTNFAENKLTDHMFRNQPLNLPASWYVALFTTTPTDAGGGTEVTGQGYARVAITRSLANFAGTQGSGTTDASNGTSGTTSNNNEVQFGAPTADWGTIVAIGIMDAAEGGNMWAYGPLAQAKTVNNNDPAPKFEAGALQIVTA